MSYLLLQSGDRLSLQGTGALLLQADGDAPPPSPRTIKATYREHIEAPTRLAYQETP
jgi:hypothetical protein